MALTIKSKATPAPISSEPAYTAPFAAPSPAQASETPPTAGYTPKARPAAPSPTAAPPTEDEDRAYDEAQRKVRLNTSPQGGKAAKAKKNAKKDMSTPLTKGDLNRMLAATDTPLAEITVGEGDDDMVDTPTGRRPRATQEALEYRRKQIMRLVIRGVPKQTIAQHLGLSIKQVYSDMVEINKEVRYELTNFDYQGYIGMSLAFYEECRNIALRLATDSAEKSNSVKMQAINAALKAEDSKHEFLTKVGLFKVTSPTDPFASINTGRQGSYSDQNDTNDFLQSIAHAREKYMGNAQEVTPATPTEGKA